MGWQLQLCNIGRNGSHVAAAGELAYATILVRRLLLVTLLIVLRGMIVLRGLSCLTIGLLHVLMQGRIVMRDIGFHGGMAVATQSLHGDRNSQRVAAE